MSLYIIKDNEKFEPINCNVISDWNETNEDSLSFVKRKPSHSLQLIETSYANAEQDSTTQISDTNDQDIFYVRKWNTNPGNKPVHDIITNTYRGKERLKDVFINGERIDELWRNGNCFYQYKPEEYTLQNLITRGYRGGSFRPDSRFSTEPGYLQGTLRGAMGLQSIAFDKYFQDGIDDAFMFEYTMMQAEGAELQYGPDFTHIDFAERTTSLDENWNLIEILKETTVIIGRRYYLRALVQILNNSYLKQCQFANGFNGETLSTKIYDAFGSELNQLQTNNWTLIECEWLANTEKLSWIIRFPFDENSNLSNYTIFLGNLILSEIPDGYYMNDIKTAAYPVNYWENVGTFIC